ncbi:EF-hand domain-containing protein [Pseudorhodobacter sp. E13]|uniref:EF-hand domain-containing protein n=1 Tax=Pseudorhodobacter sp. E13 TaxID=2487931 RepID=UPI000F8EBFCB|nr:EF-hand domain-containing protein [Pseudorhodobacter sp. E13]RUS60892.1 EF-hand domain-containing protein [Pseudorhodobacter sp. E13]
MRTFFLLTTALTLIAGMALAQQGQPGAQFIEQWDMDGDGQVTLAEAIEKRGEIFVMFDKEADGTMDAADFDGVAEHLAAENANKGSGHGMGNGPGKLIHEAMSAAYNDADGDGLVTPEEFRAATETLFAAIDRNSDGLMTSADFGRQ